MSQDIYNLREYKNYERTNMFGLVLRLTKGLSVFRVDSLWQPKDRKKITYLFKVETLLHQCLSRSKSLYMLNKNCVGKITLLIHSEWL